MTITLDVLRSWRDPRGVIRTKLAAGQREDQALATLMGACALIFVAQWPWLSREAFLQPNIPLEARIVGALMACVFLLPLILYALAAMSHLVARFLGGKGSWFTARMALFWALFAVSPLMLLNGLVAGFIGYGTVLSVVNFIVAVGFLYLWINMLIEAER
ncbi:MAG: YIP1 family protein [Rhodobacteraceae bacterium]|nr:YIP1 family protein [Paracoccaceae bacterium]